MPFHPITTMNELLNVNVITEPAEEPLTLTETKLHLRVDAADENTLITALIVAARIYCENKLNRALITQTLELSLDRFPRTIDRFDAFTLPRPPLQSVTSFKFTDSDGVETTLVEDTDYVVDTDSFMGRISRKRDTSWPTDILKEIGAIKIRYVAGFGDAADIPQNIKQAMLLLISHWFENRETSLSTGAVNQEIEFAVTVLLGQDTIVNI